MNTRLENIKKRLYKLNTRRINTSTRENNALIRFLHHESKLTSVDLTKIENELSSTENFLSDIERNCTNLELLATDIEKRKA